MHQRATTPQCQKSTINWGYSWLTPTWTDSWLHLLFPAILLVTHHPSLWSPEALCLFVMCTLHKLPHLLGSEVLYCHSPTWHEQWDEWQVPLTKVADQLVTSFLSQITSLPPHANLIAYLSVPHVGLGLLDAQSHTIPNLWSPWPWPPALPSMESVWEGTKLHFRFHRPCLFLTQSNPNSIILQLYHHPMLQPPLQLHFSPWISSHLSQHLW